MTESLLRIPCTTISGQGSGADGTTVHLSIPLRKKRAPHLPIGMRP